GVTNAFNLIDGLDGLATGIALVALATMLAVSAKLGNWEVALVCAALAGALAGFLRYNLRPARIFLGDSGSLFVGFMLAVLSVYGSQKAATAILAVVPLFALAVPLLDTGLAILRRWLRGIPISQADGRHIHHRLLALGLTHRNAVIVLYVSASVLAMLGLSLVFAPPPAVMSVAAAGAGVTLFLLVYGLRRLQYHEFVEAGAVLASGLARVRRTIRDRIYAQDLGQVVWSAGTFEEVNAVLEDNASTFGFLHMEVCRESATGSRPLVLFDGHAARAWKLDYPVTWHDFVESDDYVLRIWCNPRAGARPYGAERVAQILAPVIEEWMARYGPQRAAVRAFGPGLELERAEAERVLEVVEVAKPARLGLVRPRA
ncbi:MAG TPA: MraY family glycosyltransferase, partial [Longimicrobium sp.]|nr:MraY family glycosyltransferase [Longimicrobium sp.]